MIRTPPHKTCSLRDLHGKILKITVIEPNPETLDFEGYVIAQDEKGTTYLLEQWTWEGLDGASVHSSRLRDDGP